MSRGNLRISYMRLRPFSQEKPWKQENHIYKHAFRLFMVLVIECECFMFMSPTLHSVTAGQHESWSYCEPVKYMTKAKVCA